ncbi:MAG: hypothetical protein FWF19_06155, partial [Euryarchaeota archaeon]|nr:hypothetical protein [Euryarchaeota archaeon]
AAVDENLAMLNNIVTSISDINHNAVDVASFVEEQVGAIEDVTMSIATISDRIKHTVKRVGQMSTTAEETGAAITEIGEIFDEIYFITKEISGKIAQFQLNESDPAIAPFQLNENEPT